MTSYIHTEQEGISNSITEKENENNYNLKIVDKIKTTTK